MKYSVALLSTLAVLVAAKDIKARAPVAGVALEDTPAAEKAVEAVVEEVEVENEEDIEEEVKEEVEVTEEEVKEEVEVTEEEEEEEEECEEEVEEEEECEEEVVEEDCETTTEDSSGVTEYPEDWVHTVYTTTVTTVSDCPEETTDCPADKHRETTVVVAVSTTVCPPEEWTEDPCPETTHYEEPCPETTHYEEECPETTVYEEDCPEETWTPSWTSEYHQPTESSYPCDNDYDCPAAPVYEEEEDSGVDYEEENSGVDYEEPVVTAGASAARVGGALVAAAVAALLL